MCHFVLMHLQAIPSLQYKHFQLTKQQSKMKQYNLKFSFL